MSTKDNEIIGDSPRLILASGSPRRADLLDKMGLVFEINPPKIPETRKHKEFPKDFAQRLALEKARSTAKCTAGNNQQSVYILGTDTIVVLKDEILGKPANKGESINYLKKLSGKTHKVISGYAIIKHPDTVIVSDTEISKVVMRKISDKEIEDYIQTGEPLDKAGAYAIQGIGGKFIEKVEGSVNNVIGLPTEALLPWFEKLKLL